MQTPSITLHTSELQESPTSDFDDLDQFLAEALESQTEGKRLKEGRKTLANKNNNLTEAERQQLAEDIHRMELAREWNPKADVAMFEVQTCSCCQNVSSSFLGFFQRQSHRFMHHADRWVPVAEQQNIGLPKEIKNVEVTHSVCAFCVGNLGYPLDQMGIEYEDELETDAEIIEAADAGAVAEEIASLRKQLVEYEELVEELMAESTNHQSLTLQSHN